MKTYSLTEKNKNKFVNLKNNYVLKPTHLNEGIGVIIGPDTDQKEWEELINKNTDNNYLLQEFITIEKKEATLYEN